MKETDLLPLALQACHDHTAQPVLGDAVLEAGWWDRRVMWLVVGDAAAGGWAARRLFFHSRQTMADERNRNRFVRRAARPDRRWCRAVAAVLLFAEWQTETWSTWERCRVEPRWWADALASQGIHRLEPDSEPHPDPVAALRELQALIDRDILSIQQAYALMDAPLEAPRTFLGVNRETDPTRLAGMRLVGGPNGPPMVVEAQDGRGGRPIEAWDAELRATQARYARIIDAWRFGPGARDEE